MPHNRGMSYDTHDMHAYAAQPPNATKLALQAALGLCAALHCVGSEGCKMLHLQADCQIPQSCYYGTRASAITPVCGAIAIAPLFGGWPWPLCPCNNTSKHAAQQIPRTDTDCWCMMCVCVHQLRSGCTRCRALMQCPGVHNAMLLADLTLRTDEAGPSSNTCALKQQQICL